MDDDDFGDFSEGAEVPVVVSGGHAVPAVIASEGGNAGAAVTQGEGEEEEEEDVWESAMAAVAATTTAVSPARPLKPSSDDDTLPYSDDPALASTSAAPPSLPFIAPLVPLPTPSMDGSFSAMSTALQHHDDDDPFADIANSPVRAATAQSPVLPPLSLSGLTGGMQAGPMAAAIPPVSSLLVEEDLLAPSTVMAMAEGPLSSAGQPIDMLMQDEPPSLQPTPAPSLILPSLEVDGGIAPSSLEAAFAELGVAPITTTDAGGVDEPPPLLQSTPAPSLILPPVETEGGIAASSLSAALAELEVVASASSDAGGDEEPAPPPPPSASLPLEELEAPLPVVTASSTAEEEVDASSVLTLSPASTTAPVPLSPLPQEKADGTGARQSSPSPPPRLSSPQPPTTGADVDDDFGDFSAPAPVTTADDEPPMAAVPPEAVSETAPPLLPPEVAVTVSPRPAATEKEEDDDFGDFAEPPSVTAATEPTAGDPVVPLVADGAATAAVSSTSPPPVEEDLFGAATAAVSSRSPPPAEEEDLFVSATAAVSSPTAAVSSSPPPPPVEEEGLVEPAPAVACPDAGLSGEPSSSVDATASPPPDEAEDDDFEHVATSQEVEAERAAEKAASPPPPAGGDDDDFGDFSESVPAPAVPKQVAGPPSPSPPPPPPEATAAVAADDDDDWGDFGEANLPAPAPAPVTVTAPAVTAAPAVVSASLSEDDDFGDFDAAPPTASAPGITSTASSIHYDASFLTHEEKGVEKGEDAMEWLQVPKGLMGVARAAHAFFESAYGGGDAAAIRPVDVDSEQLGESLGGSLDKALPLCHYFEAHASPWATSLLTQELLSTVRHDGTIDDDGGEGSDPGVISIAWALASPQPLRATSPSSGVDTPHRFNFNKKSAADMLNEPEQPPPPPSGARAMPGRTMSHDEGTRTGRSPPPPTQSQKAVKPTDADFKLLGGGGVEGQKASPMKQQGLGGAGLAGKAKSLGPVAFKEARASSSSPVPREKTGPLGGKDMGRTATPPPSLQSTLSSSMNATGLSLDASAGWESGSTSNAREKGAKDVAAEVEKVVEMFPDWSYMESSLPSLPQMMLD